MILKAASVAVLVLAIIDFAGWITSPPPDVNAVQVVEGSPS